MVHIRTLPVQYAILHSKQKRREQLLYQATHDVLASKVLCRNYTDLLHFVNYWQFDRIGRLIYVAQP